MYAPFRNYLYPVQLNSHRVISKQISTYEVLITRVNIYAHPYNLGSVQLLLLD